tara:strand:- start:356 stop:1837 length:1482 start_codon:yes stop_codon:yes gene_type:complete
MTLKKYVKYTFIIFNSILTFLLLLNFKANFIYILLFSILLNYYFIVSFQKKIYSIHFFLSFFFWIGFWLKLCLSNIEVTYSLHLFQPVGNFYENFYSTENINYANKTLLVSIIGVSGFVLSLTIQKFFLVNQGHSIYQKRNFSGFQKFFDRYKNIIILLFVVSFILVSSFNYNHSIYQRGIIGENNINFFMLSVFKWLLLFGFTSFSAILIFHSLSRKKFSIMLILISILENFVSSISMLSRGMFVNTMAVIFGLYKHKSEKNEKLFSKKFIFIIFFGFIFFFLSISITNNLRSIKYSNYNNLENTGNFQKSIKVLAENNFNIKKNINEVFIILSNRFVGLEQTFDVVKNSKDLNYKLLLKSFEEKKNFNRLTFFDEKIKKSKFHENQSLKNNKTYFINVPGIIAYLFYSGSYIFLFLSTFFIGLILSFFEKLILFIFYNNYILSCLISQTIAYRLNNFGYIPSNTYLILSTIIINLLVIFIVYAVSGKYFNK